MDLARHWRAIFDTISDGVFVVDAQGIIVAVNPAAGRILGREAADLEGQPCSILDCTACAAARQGSPGHWCALFAKGKGPAKRCFIRNASGELAPVVKRALVLKDENGQVLGAVETLTDLREIAEREAQITSLRAELKGEGGFHGLIAASAKMSRLVELLKNAAVSGAPVLIRGESGVGKEMVAQALHAEGPRAQGPFIKFNCAALNPNLLESELFGHVKGAFTGAASNREGRFQAAHGGDIFLDEIGDLPVGVQVKLLRVLEQKEIERVGDHHPLQVDVRVITATNRDLEALVSEGKFREDLYYRINVLPVFVPPLRERPEDLPVLVDFFLARANLADGKNLAGVSQEAMRQLLAHRWPGNVRELRNALDYARVLCHRGLIRPEHLPPTVTEAAPAVAPAPEPAPAKPRPRLDRPALEAALREAGGNQSRAGALLGVSRVTVWKKLKGLGINPADYK